MGNPIGRWAFAGSALAQKFFARVMKGRGAGEAQEATDALGPPSPTHASRPLPVIRTERVFGLSVADFSRAAAVRRIIAWSQRTPARTVIMAELDHVIAARDDPVFHRACEEADLVLAGGPIFAWLARSEGGTLERRVPAEELVEPLMRAAEAAGRSVFILGPPLETAHATAERLKIRFPALKLAGIYAPPEAFWRDPQMHLELGHVLRCARPDIVLVGLASRVQEVWSAGMADGVRHGVFVNLGQGLEAWARADEEGPPGFWGAAGARLSAALVILARGGRMAVLLPWLYAFHRRDRARYGAAQRRRMIALQTDDRFRAVREATRGAEADAALRGRLGAQGPHKKPPSE
ncbi:MAG: WecB/TagA/CpsF family glycosyltransferase [Pseudomonadota bacterium]